MMAITQVLAILIIKRYIANWSNNEGISLSVLLASPGDAINMLGRTFGTVEAPIAGMHAQTAGREQVIVLNMKMVPESLLSTFFHEYGHCRFALEHRDGFDVVASEVAAIRCSLEALTAEGYPELAYREAQCVRQMSVAEPYKSAVAILSSDPIWQKFCQPMA